ncbi:MAG: DUF937 domain-containing protein [Gloeotrichia echinulata IR180]
MGLFDFEQIMGAVANSGQLGNIISTVEHLSNSTGVDLSTLQSVLPVIEGQVRSALQDKEATDGNEAVQSLISQFAGTTDNPEAVDSVFSPEAQQQVAETVAQRTGLDASIIQQILPLAVPVVLKFLHFGGNAENP